MSDGGKAFRTFLLTKPAVTDLIGTRIYAHDLPQNYKLPAIAYHVISEIPDDHLLGQSDLTQYRIQLDCYGEGTDAAGARNAAKAVAEAVRNVTAGRPGQPYPGQMGTEFCQDASLDSARDDTDGPRDASGKYRHLYQQDWILSFTESIPTG